METLPRNGLKYASAVHVGNPQYLTHMLQLNKGLNILHEDHNYKQPVKW